MAKRATKRKSAKVGRPAMPKRERRRHVIPLRVDDAELRAINERADELGVSRSEFIREAVMKAARRRKGKSLSRGAEVRSR